MSPPKAGGKLNGRVSTALLRTPNIKAIVRAQEGYTIKITELDGKIWLTAEALPND